MKFMKLGNQPDTFYTVEAVRSVSSEDSSNLIIQVKENKYLLHKVPLLSRCLRLQRIYLKSPESSELHKTIQLNDFPSGVEAFELCAKFCYGMKITVSAYNIVSARCAAEYLQMTEDVEKGNLIYKLEVFLNSCILHGWRDSIVTLQSTKAFPSWSEELGITSRCIEAIALKVFTHPSEATVLSQCRSRRNKQENTVWWAGDLAELEIDLYLRTTIAIKSDLNMPANLVGDALKIYAARWLPNISKNGCADNQEKKASYLDAETNEVSSKQRLILESIISLLPAENGSVSCSFLLKLLKAANVLNAASSSKMELAKRVGFQLDEATVDGLLMPSRSNTNDSPMYDVDIVMTIVDNFMLQGQSPPISPPRSKPGFEGRRSRSAESIEFELQESRRSCSSSHSAKLKVAKLVDRYLQEIARDVNLSLSKFIALADAVPKFARLDHDDLYRAVDIYLKAHSELNKSEKKWLCRILDCRKLSMEACMHAAQNQLLPLRVVVQVLFFEQARAAKATSKVTDLPSNLKKVLATQNTDPSSPSAPLSTVTGLKSTKSKISSTLQMKFTEDDELDENVTQLNGIQISSKDKGLCSLPTRPKRMFSKFCAINRRVS